MSQAQVTITRRGAERVRGGHLWVYRSDVREAGVAAGGSVVAVRDERGRFVARALYSDRSEIALRVLTTKDEPVGRDWWRARLRASAARREGIEREADAFRLVYSEGDLLPSLIVDRYSDVLVLQTLSQGAESLKATLVELLVEEFAPRAVVERNDVRVRSLEGLPLQTGVLYGDAPEELEVVQHGVRQEPRERRGSRARLQGDKPARLEDARTGRHARHMHMLLSHDRAALPRTHRGGRDGRTPTRPDSRAPNTVERPSRPARRPR